ncbi:sulfurtransferase complex subunit TusD [Halomonas sp. MCCC 1A17488]|uniref:Sulfurtransferase complex subunit TusD n=1 Tax=Billgrantia sulfidoxydans TaxID=2733484 RepID=A0ABX7W628_9GAMM|nr:MULTISPECIES: sulfurtransferase complex subunit TusD [Halomonas]MCE8015161.1 sulfurtransferase complex subunit TusD [Halomonas sp. MCCC 1A17488]MCG3238494.1 sulfurtransferase complex subunit TusD [Halomonas sp. MCCC 1A17488]QPP47765.1 sulfurtransferase complex subunit TusD [Halomonas sp. SS10-MC5]QTP55072.1 sulfurtransferase complex subunit TusD [Halomonas sulfidoxydans]
MRYGLLVEGAPYSSQASHSALRFAMALIARGHRVESVFFYHDGVYNASRLAAPPQDEPHLHDAWCSLHAEHATRLQVCIAAALRRGLLDSREADRHGKSGHSVEPPFELTGLGQLVDLGHSVDRLVTFAP